MATSVTLTPELERFAQDCVETGRFGTVNDVVQSALAMLRDAEARRAAFVASLEEAVVEGDRIGFVTADEIEVEAATIIGATSSRRA